MTRKQFTEEFKAEAIRLVKEGGVSVSRAAQDLGIGESTLSKWLKIAAANSPEPLTLNEKEELRVLRKEVTQLRMERDILKKATAYFAKINS
jgi:transposase